MFTWQWLIAANNLTLNDTSINGLFIEIGMMIEIENRRNIKFDKNMADVCTRWILNWHTEHHALISSSALNTLHATEYDNQYQKNAHNTKYQKISKNHFQNIIKYKKQIDRFDSNIVNQLFCVSMKTQQDLKTLIPVTNI